MSLPLRQKGSSKTFRREPLGSSCHHSSAPAAHHHPKVHWAPAAPPPGLWEAESRGHSGHGSGGEGQTVGDAGQP